MKVSMLRIGREWPAHLDWSPCSCASVVVVDHGSSSAFTGGAGCNRVAVFTAVSMRPSRPPSRGRRILGVRPFSGDCPQSPALGHSVRSLQQRDQVYRSECHYSWPRVLHVSSHRDAPVLSLHGSDIDLSHATEQIIARWCAAGVQPSRFAVGSQSGFIS
jgi:hypothetical protein